MYALLDRRLSIVYSSLRRYVLKSQYALDVAAAQPLEMDLEYAAQCSSDLAIMMWPLSLARNGATY